MDVRVLGPIEVRVGGDDVTPTSPNQRTVLAVLAAHPDQHVRIDTLVDAIWGDEPPATAERTLRSYVSRLRAAVGPNIVAGGGGFCLRTSGVTLDSVEFERRVDAARMLGARAAAETLRGAVDLWHGSAFGECAELAAVCAKARALEQLKITARQQLAEALLRSEQFSPAIVQAEELLAELPLDELTWEIKIRGLSGVGRTADALAAYRDAYQALSAVGLEPSERLRRAQSDIFDSPSTTVPSTAPHGCELLGRDRDLEAIAEILTHRNLVTVVGPGGVGKTALAREVARRRGAAHGGGVRVVELAAVTDPSAVPDAVATALGLTSDGSPTISLLSRARFMDVVVLLDNCEHVLDAACDVLAMMLGSEPTTLRVVATSRELLGMPDESAWPLDPLDCSRADSPAQQYFRLRAQASRPGALSGADDDAVDSIVRSLDGLPLAIELAAAQVATLGIGDVGEQIEESVSGPQALQRLVRRGGEPRHRTLRAAIEWSERLLSSPAREALSEWSAFAGAVNRADAQAVLDVGPDVVDELARSSLLSVEIRSGRAYYRMLQTVRAVVDPACETTRRRHMEYFAESAAHAARLLETPQEVWAHGRLTELVDELRVAHAYARGADVPAAVRMSMALHRFAVSRLQTEILGWAPKLSPLVQSTPELRAAVDSSLAYRCVIAEQLDSAQQRAHSALADAADDQTRCRAIEALGDCGLFLGELDDAARWWAELTSVGSGCGDVYYELIGRAGTAMALAYGGQKDAAGRALAEIVRAFADRPLSYTQQSWLAYLHGEVVLDDDPDLALTSFRRAITLADAGSSLYVGGVARVSAISLQSRHSQAGAALPLFADVIERWIDVGSFSHLLTTLRNLVPTLTDVGLHVVAARVLGAVTRVDQTPSYGEELERISAARSALVSALGPAEFERHHAAGGMVDLAPAGRAAVASIRELTSP